MTPLGMVTVARPVDRPTEKVPDASSSPTGGGGSWEWTAPGKTPGSLWSSRKEIVVTSVEAAGETFQFPSNTAHKRPANPMK